MVLPRHLRIVRIVWLHVEVEVVRAFAQAVARLSAIAEESCRADPDVHVPRELLFELRIRLELPRHRSTSLLVVIMVGSILGHA